MITFSSSHLQLNCCGRIILRKKSYHLFMYLYWWGPFLQIRKSWNFCVIDKRSLFNLHCFESCWIHSHNTCYLSDTLAHSLITILSQVWYFVWWPLTRALHFARCSPSLSWSRIMFSRRVCSDFLDRRHWSRKQCPAGTRTRPATLYFFRYPTRFSFRNHRVAGNPKHRVLPDISGTTRYSGYYP